MRIASGVRIDPSAFLRGVSVVRALPRAHGLLWLASVMFIFPSAMQGQTIAINDVTLMESDTGTVNAVFTVTRSGITPLQVRVDYATSDGSATAPDDYQSSMGTLTFMGTQSQTISVPIKGDKKSEPNETFFVDLSNAVNATITDGRGRGTILNDDPLPKLSIDDVTVVEDHAGTTDATFAVSLAGDFCEPVTVRYDTADGTATVADRDYRPRGGTLTFQPGEAVTQITISINGDTRVEPNENFFINLSNVVNAMVVDGQGVGTILNDDEPPPLPILSIDDEMLLEGNAGSENMEFTVTLTGEISEPVTVRYATADGTATVLDNDYQAVADTLTFQPDGAMTRAQQIEIPINGDIKSESDETFLINLSSAHNATIVDGQGQGTIWNDDPPPGLSINDVMVIEGDSGSTMAKFTVTLAGKFSEPVTVRYATKDGTATVADDDYESVSGVLEFQPEDKAMTVTVEVNGDSRAEPDETFFVNLSEAVNATISDTQGQGTIKDRDPELMLSIGDVMMDEGDIGTEASLTVTLMGKSNETVTVRYATADGTATVADGDYQPVSDVLTFPPGEAPQTQVVTISINGDNRVESNEEFFVNLSDPHPKLVEIKDDQGVVTLKNDDVESKLRLSSAPSAIEGAGMAVVTVERNGEGSEAARVTVTADSGTAQAGEDFTAVSQVLEWGPRESGTRSFEIPILDDNLQEEDETIVVRLSDAGETELGEPAELELVIVDDDTPMKVEPDGEPERTAEANEEIELKVSVLRDDGEPLQGVVVVWQLEGNAELLDGETTLTDADGVATQHVRLGATGGSVVVMAEVQGTDNVVSFEIQVEGSLADIPMTQVSPGEAAVAAVLDESCASATGDFDQLCDFIFQLGDQAEQVEVLEELTPEEVSAQGSVSQSSPRVQLGNISSRLATLRAGAMGRVAVGQIAFNFSSGSLGLGQLQAGLAKYGEEKERVAGALDRALAAEGQGSGGGGRADQRDPDSAEDSRLGFFFSGKISIGDRPNSEREAGFDFETQGLTAGMDYSFSDRLVGGVAVGYMDTETEIVSDGGQLEAQGYSLSTFGMYHVGNLFIEGVLSYGRNDYDQVRNIDLPRPFQGQNRFVARGNAEGEQLTFGLGFGYEAAFGATSIAGTGNVTWVDAAVDGFAERGAGPFNLRIEDQTIESLQSQAKLDLSRAITLPSWNAVIHPVLGLAYLHEFENDSRLIRGSFVDDQTGSTFDVPTDSPDRDFFRLSAGLTVAFIRGRSAFLLYDKDLDRKDLNIYTITMGLRLGM